MLFPDVEFNKLRLPAYCVIAACVVYEVMLKTSSSPGAWSRDMVRRIFVFLLLLFVFFPPPSYPFGCWYGTVILDFGNRL